MVFAAGEKSDHHSTLDLYICLFLLYDVMPMNPSQYEENRSFLCKITTNRYGDEAMKYFVITEDQCHFRLSSAAGIFSRKEFNMLPLIESGVCKQVIGWGLDSAQYLQLVPFAAVGDPQQNHNHGDFAPRWC